MRDWMKQGFRLKDPSDSTLRIYQRTSSSDTLRHRSAAFARDPTTIDSLYSARIHSGNHIGSYRPMESCCTSQQVCGKYVQVPIQTRPIQHDSANTISLTPPILHHGNLDAAALQPPHSRNDSFDLRPVIRFHHSLQTSTKWYSGGRSGVVVYHCHCHEPHFTQGRGSVLLSPPQNNLHTPFLGQRGSALMPSPQHSTHHSEPPDDNTY
jgi:hypothetical protein